MSKDYFTPTKEHAEHFWNEQTSQQEEKIAGVKPIEMPNDILVRLQLKKGDKIKIFHKPVGEYVHVCTEDGFVHSHYTYFNEEMETLVHGAGRIIGIHPHGFRYEVEDYTGRRWVVPPHWIEKYVITNNYEGVEINE